MSVHYHILVPDKVPEKEANNVATLVINYLIERKIIHSTKTDCVFRDELGYPPAENYADVVHHAQDNFYRMNPNGVSVTLKRSVFHASDLEAILCPKCGNNILDLEWSDAVSKWYNNEKDHWIACSRCKDINPITDYEFQPTWAFGYLGFQFYNWGVDVKESFIKELEILTGFAFKVIVGGD